MKATKSDAYALARKIAAVLDEKKASDIVIIDLSEKSIIADYFVIASGRSTTAVKSLTDNVDEKLSKEGIEPLRRDGFSEAKWIAVDYGSVILHVFHEETREYYRLERLWIDGGNCEKYGEGA
ncbi:MAG TPA: ribosome silencing factor [Firmicutes bacterium]|nr:ribosome silencing factor [Bacillota bacterium]